MEEWVVLWRWMRWKLQDLVMLVGLSKVAAGPRPGKVPTVRRLAQASVFPLTVWCYLAVMSERYMWQSPNRYQRGYMFDQQTHDFLWLFKLTDLPVPDLRVHIMVLALGDSAIQLVGIALGWIHAFWLLGVRMTQAVVI